MFGVGYESFVYGCACDRCGQAFIANPLKGDRTDLCPTCLVAAARREAARCEAALFGGGFGGGYGGGYGGTTVVFVETPKKTYCLREGCTAKTTARGGYCSSHRCGNCKGPKDKRSTLCNKCKSPIPVYYDRF